MWETNINAPRADSCFKHCESNFIASLGEITIPGEVGRDGGYLFWGGLCSGPESRTISVKIEQENNNERVHGNKDQPELETRTLGERDDATLFDKGPRTGRAFGLAKQHREQCCATQS